MGAALLWLIDCRRLCARSSRLGGTPALNAGSTFAFFATLDVGGQGIFTGSDGPTTTIADTAGPFSQFFDPALNAGGAVAFRAFLDAGGSGIFTGPDPVSDAVIRTGDTLFGGTVTSLFFSRNELNDSGQVVFLYELDNLANGIVGIAVATPVPEPASLLSACSAPAYYGGDGAGLRNGFPAIGWSGRR